MIPQNGLTLYKQKNIQIPHAKQIACAWYPWHYFKMSWMKNLVLWEQNLFLEWSRKRLQNQPGQKQQSLSPEDWTFLSLELSRTRLLSLRLQWQVAQQAHQSCLRRFMLTGHPCSCLQVRRFWRKQWKQRNRFLQRGPMTTQNVLKMRLGLRELPIRTWPWTLIDWQAWRRNRIANVS